MGRLLEASLTSKHGPRSGVLRTAGAVGLLLGGFTAAALAIDFCLACVVHSIF